MGRVGRLIKTEIEKYITQTVETYLKLNQSCYQYGPSGEDAPPLENDRIILIKEDGTGKYCAAGILTVSQGANPGEKFIYSRGTDGSVKAIIKMLNDGSLTIEGATDEGTSVSINGGGKAAARVDDDVEIEIPAGSVVVSVSGGGGSAAVGTLNAEPIKCSGKIKSGSDTVEIG